MLQIVHFLFSMPVVNLNLADGRQSDTTNPSNEDTRGPYERNRLQVNSHCVINSYVGHHKFNYYSV